MSSLRRKIVQTLHGRWFVLDRLLMRLDPHEGCRQELALWGLSDMTDEELEEGALAIAEMVRAAGIDIVTAGENVAKLSGVRPEAGGEEGKDDE